MSKFNVGDIVRVRDWEDMVEEYGIDCSGEDIAVPNYPFVSTMKGYCDCIFEVADANYCGEDAYQLSDCDEWLFSKDMLRLVRRVEVTNEPEPVQANVLFAFSAEGVEVEEEFVITNKGDNAYDYTINDKEKMIQALADYFELEINFLTRNCSVEDEMEDVPLETINEDEEKIEPYNGKVICIEPYCGLTKGKIYEVTEGFFFDNEGTARPASMDLLHFGHKWFTEGLLIPVVEG